MAKFKEKIIALKLRKEGNSIKDIAKKLRVAKSTVSKWCRDIELTKKQIQNLAEKMKAGAYKGARAQYVRRLERIKKCEITGINKIGKLSNRDFLLTGLALYWGEGTKKNGKVVVCNSDPRITKFMIKWFKKIFKVRSDRFTLRVGINKIHQNRINEVEEYWSKEMVIPRMQFGKTFLIKTKSKKVYNNFSTHFGTLRVEVKKPAEIYCQILGLIKGLSRCKI